MLPNRDIVEYQEELQLLQNENEKLKKEIETLKSCHTEEMYRFINIINDKSQSMKLTEKEHASAEKKLYIMSSTIRERDRPLALNGSKTSMFHPSDIIEKKLKSQFYFFDTL